MTDETDMTPSIKAFFDKALPKGKGGHVLALGEAHTDHRHITYLHQHMDALVHAHGLGTIGVEMPAFMNVLFWAYQDGTLEKQCGSKAAARTYFCQLMSGWCDKEHQYNTQEKADLLMQAMDSGVRVVAFDSRDMFAKAKKDYPLRSMYEEEEEIDGVAISYPMQREQEPLVRQQLIQHLGKRRMPAHLLVHEIYTLLRDCSDYSWRLDHMEDLIQRGRKKDIGSDAISAALFSAAQDTTKNALTISGIDHIATAGGDDRLRSERIHGTFPHHIRWIGDSDAFAQPLQVTRAVLAGVAEAKMAEKDYRAAIRYHYQSYNLDAPTLASRFVAGRASSTYTRSRFEEPDQLVNFETDAVTDLPQPSVAQAAPIAVRFMKPWALMDGDLTLSRMNPLLVPEIKRAYDAVRADWNPELVQQRGGR
jgi:hypothetical protein